MFISDRRLYLDDAGNVVEHGDPAARTLLCGEGCEVDLETVTQYNLKHRQPATENKLSTKAPANKQVKE